MAGQVMPSGSSRFPSGVGLPNKAKKRAEEEYAAKVARYNDTRDSIDAIANVTDFTVLRLALLKRNQNTLELMVPDAMEWINLAANTGAMNMVRRLAEYEG